MAKTEGEAFDRLRVQLADIRHRLLRTRDVQPIETIAGEVEMARCVWLLIPGTSIAITQALYRTDATCWLNDEPLGTGSDGSRIYAEGVALLNALCHPHLNRGADGQA